MVSIVIPAYNEENAVGETVNDVRKVMKKSSYKEFEVIVVDDGSSDNTAERAKKAGAFVISHPHNAGYGRALKTGITNAKFDKVVITDADGTYPSVKIVDILKLFDTGFDMVVGERTGKNYRESPLKWPMRLLLRFLVEWTTGRKIPDINSGFRVFSKKTIITYFGQLCDTFSFTTSATLAYMMTSKFVAYTKIEYSERVGSSHVRLWSDSLRTLQYIIQAITYYNPLKIFILLSVGCLVLAFVSIFIGILFSMHTGFMMVVGFLLIIFVALIISEQTLAQKYNTKLFQSILGFLHSLKLVITDLKIISRVIALQLISLLLICMTIKLLFHAGNSNVPFYYLIAFMPPIFIFSQLPITIGGWGTRELAMITSFSLINISKELAFSVSLVFGFLNLTSAFLGILFYLDQKKS